MKDVVVLGLFAVVGALAGSLAGQVLTGAPPPEEGATLDQERLFQRLDRLVQAIERGVRTEREPLSAPLPEREVTPPPEGTTLADLLECLKGIRTLLQSGLQPVIQAPQGEKGAPGEVASAIDLVAADRKAASRAHFCWTPVAIAQKYGMPDSVDSIGGSTYWVYRDERQGRDLTFKFVDGVVVALY
ncbi:MAG: hypothetical protein AB1486_29420 [Planctomycetota bacterium]